ncbi:hypothetical protein PTI98_012459 [Pleurotus ostreatus]|nr:hypothetical protein PTI98_012459 [Pleurotus ostreatus]
MPAISRYHDWNANQLQIHLEASVWRWDNAAYFIDPMMRTNTHTVVRNLFMRLPREFSPVALDAVPDGDTKNSRRIAQPRGTGRSLGR